MPHGDWVVVANEAGSRPPLVFLHTWDNEATHIHNLAAHLGPDQPLYGIEPPDGTAGPLPGRVEGWLEHHLGRLRQLPVTPPYRLAGFSFGGVLALEAARRLEAEGTPVAYLALIDTMRPKLNPRGVGKWLEYHALELVGYPVGHRRDYVRRIVLISLSRTRARMRRRTSQIAHGLGLRSEAHQTLGDAKAMPPLMRSIHRAYLNYEAVPYDHPVALFYTNGSAKRSGGDVSLRWSRFLRGGFDAYRVKGFHTQIFHEDMVASFADALARSLAVAEIHERGVPLTRRTGIVGSDDVGTPVGARQSGPGH